MIFVNKMFVRSPLLVLHSDGEPSDEESQHLPSSLLGSHQLYLKIAF